MLRARKKLIVERGVLAALIKRANIQIYREALCLQMFFKTIYREDTMNSTILDVMSHCSYNDDKKSITFLNYILLKYFSNNDIFMKINQVLPFLEKNDREQLKMIAVRSGRH